jgi:hypothetical protein
MTSFNTGTSAATAGSGAAPNIQLTIPAGVLAGDAVLIVACGFAAAAASTLSASSTGTTPTLIDRAETAFFAGQFSSGGAWYFPASGTDAGKIVTVSTSSGNIFWGASLAAYTSANPSTPIDVHGIVTAVHAAPSSVTCPVKTTGVNGDWGVYLCAGAITNGAALAGPAGTVQRENQFASGVGSAIFDSNAGVGNSGTAIGGGTFADAGGASDWFVAFTVGLAPQSPPPAIIAAPPGGGTSMIKRRLLWGDL